MWRAFLPYLFLRVQSASFFSERAQQFLLWRLVFSIKKEKEFVDPKNLSSWNLLHLLTKISWFQLLIQLLHNVGRYTHFYLGHLDQLLLSKTLPLLSLCIFPSWNQTKKRWSLQNAFWFFVNKKFSLLFCLFFFHNLLFDLFLLWKFFNLLFDNIISGFLGISHLSLLILSCFSVMKTTTWDYLWVADLEGKVSSFHLFREIKKSFSGKVSTFIIIQFWLDITAHFFEHLLSKILVLKIWMIFSLILTFLDFWSFIFFFSFLFFQIWAFVFFLFPNFLKYFHFFNFKFPNNNRWRSKKRK